ncbi:TPA: MGMT family protein, partial [Candidatus Woesearchaeota archaeon]|nr:MGMT family protein [Candidatus Woesearchaeota archaeon]
VGNALNKNPYGAWSCNDERMVPCHRVVNSDGRLGGFALGTEAKKMILEKEGVQVKADKVVQFEEHLHRL